MSNAQYIKMREWNSFYDVSFIDMTKKKKKNQVVDVIVALRMTVIMVLKR